MHELSITQQLLDLTLHHAEKANAGRVTRLNLIIGEFSSVVDDSLQFYWGILAKDTIAAQAELTFERVPGVLQCLTCETTFGMKEFDSACPGCGGVKTKVLSGDEFRLDSIEIDEGADEQQHKKN